jgi:hypothetical protein
VVIAPAWQVDRDVAAPSPQRGYCREIAPEDVPGMTGAPLTREGERNAVYLIVWALGPPVVFGILNALMGLTVAAWGTIALTLVGAVWAFDRRGVSGPGDRQRRARPSPR